MVFNSEIYIQSRCHSQLNEIKIYHHRKIILRYLLFYRFILFFLLLLFVSISLLILLDIPLKSLDFKGDMRGNPLDDFQLNNLYILMIIIAISSLGSIVAIITIKELKKRVQFESSINSGNHRLSLDKVFENKNRRKILNEILKIPGIHYNELLRRCQIKTGQLQWHLKVLLHYGVIKNEKLGHYLVFRAMGEKSECSIKIPKSTTTFTIFTIIEKNPGIYSSSIAKKLNMRRNTVKYHTDKLSRNGLISSTRMGRQILFSPKFK